MYKYTISSGIIKSAFIFIEVCRNTFLWTIITVECDEIMKRFCIMRSFKYLILLKNYLWLIILYKSWKVKENDRFNIIFINIFYVFQDNSIRDRKFEVTLYRQHIRKEKVFQILKCFTRRKVQLYNKNL